MPWMPGPNARLERADPAGEVVIYTYQDGSVAVAKQTSEDVIIFSVLEKEAVAYALLGVPAP